MTNTRWNGCAPVNSDGFLAAIPNMSDHQLRFYVRALENGPSSYYAHARNLMLKEMGKRVANELRG